MTMGRTCRGGCGRELVNSQRAMKGGRRMHYAQGYCRECFEAVPAPAAGRKQLTREESAVKQAVERRLPPRERPTVFQALGLA